MIRMITVDDNEEFVNVATSMVAEVPCKADLP
jgi:hypothetical protein